MGSLRDLQRQFGIAALGGGEATFLAAVADDGLGAAARFEIYRNHVRISLTNALKLTFPVVCRLVDERFFAYAAATYIKECPPSEPRLWAYGATFPAFLEGFEPARGLPYLGDVARLEWAMNLALHADTKCPLDQTTLSRIDADRLPSLCFEFAPWHRLVASPFPIDAIWRVNQRGAEGQVNLESGGVCIEVSRRRSDVLFRALEPAVYAFRKALSERETLQSAADAALAVDPLFDLALALRDLFADGFVTAFSLDPLTEKEC